MSTDRVGFEIEHLQLLLLRQGCCRRLHHLVLGHHPDVRLRPDQCLLPVLARHDLDLERMISEQARPAEDRKANSGLAGRLAGLVAERLHHQAHGVAAGVIERQTGFRLIRKCRFDGTE